MALLGIVTNKRLIFKKFFCVDDAVPIEGDSEEFALVSGRGSLCWVTRENLQCINWSSLVLLLTCKQRSSAIARALVASGLVLAV